MYPMCIYENGKYIYVSTFPGIQTLALVARGVSVQLLQTICLDGQVGYGSRGKSPCALGARVGIQSLEKFTYGYSYFLVFQYCGQM